jgi:hypothetical protein
MRFCPMTDRKPHDEPSAVEAEKGEVIVDGPDGVAVSLTPGAANETSRRLLYAATRARGQQLNEEARRKRAKDLGR